MKAEEIFPSILYVSLVPLCGGSGQVEISRLACMWEVTDGSRSNFT